MNKFFTLILSLSTLAPIVRAEWLNDFEQAKRQAASEKKDIFLVFTGSGWSQPCARMEAQVFSKDWFEEQTRKSFVLLRIDLPYRSNLPKEVLAVRRDLAKRFRINSYPTFFYLDQMGRVYFRESGVQVQELEQYGAHVVSRKAAKKMRDSLLKKSDQTEGMARARLIVDALSELPRGIMADFYADKISELERLDPQDTLKFTKVRKREAAMSELEYSVNELFNHQSLDKLITKVDQFLKDHEPTGEERQQALTIKMNCYANSARVREAITISDEIISGGAKTRFGQAAVRKKKTLEKRLSR